ncbi:hypothetical protein H0H93_001942, partial [Arthromyces matolae]
AVVSNRTIDDTYGDSVTGVVPVYTPETGTWDDSSCTAIYIFFILANSVRDDDWTETFCDFVLDGVESGWFHHVPTSTTDYQYNTLAYSTTGLINTDHTLVISLRTIHTFLSFDYATYTFDDGSSPAQPTPPNPTPPNQTIVLKEPGSTVTTTTVASGTRIVTQNNFSHTQLSTSAPLNGITTMNPPDSAGSATAAGYTSESRSTSFSSQASSSSSIPITDDNVGKSSDGQSNHKAPVGAIVGGVIGAVALLFITLMIVLCRHRWRASLGRSANDGQVTRNAPELTPFTSYLEGAPTFSSSKEQRDTMSPFPISHSYESSSITAPANSEALRQKRQNIIKRQIKNLKTGLRVNGTINPSPISTSRWGDADVTRMLQQNQAMKTEIERLHAELNSDWALGHTDEPPPGYGRNAAGR